MKKQFVTIVALLIVAGLIGNAFRYFQPEPSRMAEFDRLPLEFGGYVGNEYALDAMVTDVLSATSTTMREYVTEDADKVDLFIGYFQSQKFGSGIHSPKHCLPGGGWRIRYNRPYELELADGTTRDINRLIIGYREYRAVMLYWFETRSGSVRSEYGLKWNLFVNALLMRPTDAAFVRVTADATDGDIDYATDRAVAFIQAADPHIQKALPFRE